MTGAGVTLVAVFTVALVGLAWPLGRYMAAVYAGSAGFVGRVLGPVERFIYTLAGVRPDEEMGWKRYAAAVLVFNGAGALALYALMRAQAGLPGNPAGLGAVPPELAFNTAVSFATNTNWQAYGGETTMSHLTQMLGLTVQNFLSAATGTAVLVALIRGLTRRQTAGLGSFWVNLTRTVLYILLPLSLVLALALASQGVVQSFSASATARLIDATSLADGAEVREQVIALGPAASQVAIKQLGTNGGGFFNVNSAHPLENPTAVTNLLELLAILLIPAALCFTFGELVSDRRQGRALLAAMVAIFVPLAIACVAAEQAPSPVYAEHSIDQAPSDASPGGNMEGKEVRFGVASSALWAVATTAASNGSVNAMHDSFSPLGGLIPMWLMQLGEIVFGGVGSGLYGMLMYVIVAVFIAGLMVGRTPEYLGKKLGAFQMKMAALAILLPAAAVLGGTALAVSTELGTGPLGNPGAHGFSEILYALSSGANNNGSAFGGLTASGHFYSATIGAAMFIGRYFVIVPVLAIAGSLAAQNTVPASAGTLPTHTPLFVGLLVGTIVLVGALTFVPALALGPVVEHLQLWAR